MMIRIPEHKKLEKVAERSQACGAFIEWLAGEGFEVRPYNRRKTGGFHLRPMLAKFFGIDERKLEAEKQAMLDDLRSE